jgi:arabinose-5-phosphate isomerase
MKESARRREEQLGLSRNGTAMAKAKRGDRLARAAEVIRLEAQTIAGLIDRLDGRFEEAVERILACRGQVIVTGMGKAGLVGAKLSATLASTGTPSLSVHPTEAMHGDLGRIRPDDVVVVLSNSGETEELKGLLPHVRRIGAAIIAITGATESSVARLADCVLDIGRLDEACPLGLAPTASTSAMMALGDALAMVVLAERGFSREDYARYHPAGSLGRKLMRVREIMRTDKELPLVRTGTSVRDVILTMSRTQGRPGAALIVDPEGRLQGIFTDGDLRRLIETGADLRAMRAGDVMSASPKLVRDDALAVAAAELMERHRVTGLLVVDEAGQLVGAINSNDLMRAKVI